MRPLWLVVNQTLCDFEMTISIFGESTQNSIKPTCIHQTCWGRSEEEVMGGHPEEGLRVRSANMLPYKLG